jgi:LPS-assembly protein
MRDVSGATILHRTLFFAALASTMALAPSARAQATPQNKTAPAPASSSIPANAPHQKRPGPLATLEAEKQSQIGNIAYADGHVDLHYKDVHMRADHVEYNDDTGEVAARGHIVLDRLDQHVEADDGHYNLNSGRGTFHHVSATLGIQRRPNPTLLISSNPLHFDADAADRLDDSTYKVHHGWITVCRPDRPTWKFYAPEATVRLEKNVQLYNADFRLLYVPIVYLPYATLPASRGRQSGFMIPDAGNSTAKGFFFGDSYYWAPTDWADAMVGATFLSKRGWSQRGDIRMRPWENAKLDISYYGVIDRGLPEPGGLEKQGGHEAHLGFDAFLPDGWRTVVDLNQLTSLTFRLAFAETFSQAVNSEVRNTTFATKSFSGFSFDVAAGSYKNFLSTSPDTYISLRSAPEVRFSSVDQAPFEHIPVYFSFDSFTGAVHRVDTASGFETPSFVERSEIAPSVTIPLHWGPWIGITPNFTLRSTAYGGQLTTFGKYLGDGFVRTTEEFTLDIRPPSFERIWEGHGYKWKHTIEPEIVYRYVTGVNDYGRFIHFDDDETLTDTNEIEYGIRQRLFRRSDDSGGDELVSWDVKEKYYFDPTFGGALIPGERNVFQALDSLTPFAFADEARHLSPIISDLRVMPGTNYDVQFRVDFDPNRGQMTAIGTLLKLKPYRQTFIQLADFSTLNLPPERFTKDFRVRTDQARALFGYGDMNRPGWNTAVGFSYDLAEHAFQNQVAQITYNGSCCGLGFEYRRISVGTVRNDNQYRIVLLIANLGSAGNLRRQEKVF